MDDPKTIRINDADVPDRRDRFEQAVKRSGANGNIIIRSLIDAWLAYHVEHGHAPQLPLRIVSAEGKKRRR